MITEEDWADIYTLSANLQKRFVHLVEMDRWYASGIWVSL